MSYKEKILKLLNEEENIMDSLKTVQKSLVDLIGLPIVEILKDSELNQENFSGLKIEQIVSQTNARGYNFNNKRIAEVLPNLIRKKVIEFRTDYNYKLYEKPKTN